MTIKATGNRSADFDAANVAFGLDKTPEGYVWHHVDNYNVKDGTITYVQKKLIVMELFDFLQ